MSGTRTHDSRSIGARHDPSDPLGSGVDDGLSLRLRPHFVFNTLNAIAQLVRRPEPDGAISLLAALGDMLQRSLEAPDGDVPLAEELAFVPRYVAVEEARYGRPLATRFDIGMLAGDALVPVFLLQPLVEDLARHVALAGTLSPCLRIRAALRGRMLDLQLRVDGAADGQSPTPLCSANGCPAVLELRDRLERRFGHEHRLAMITERAGGGLARLRIPYHTQADSPLCREHPAASSNC